MIKLLNGATYRLDSLGFVLIWFGGIPTRYGMLTIDRHTIKGMSCPMFQCVGGQYAFTVEELKSKCRLKDWIRTDGRLRIEKIDSEMSLVEYTVGGNLVDVIAGFKVIVEK